VTGGAGFIGSHIARHLLKLGHEVIILDDLSGSDGSNVPDKAQFVQGSILRERIVNNLFEHDKFDYVYHCAAYAAENLSHFIKRFNYQNNLIGSVNLINASVNHGVKCFVFTSSIAVYGNAEPPFLEDMICKPEDSYGIAKLAVEQELRISHEMFGLDYVIFRPHNVYGPGQNIADRYRNVIGIFMNQCLQGKPMTIFGDGEQVRAFSYIEDVAPLIAISTECHGMRNETFNIGGDVVTSINALPEIVAESLEISGYTIKHLAPRKEVVVACCDHSKLDNLKSLHLQNRTDLLEGIYQMGRWVKKHGPREVQSFYEIEIPKNLPEGWR
jgi:UDP-glucose 4-epimerase